MKELDAFIRALERTMGNHRGKYIPHLSIVPSKFKAIKNVKIDVWLIDGDNKELISSVSGNFNMTTDKEKEEVIGKLSVDTIENILKRYGIQ